MKKEAIELLIRSLTDKRYSTREEASLYKEACTKVIEGTRLGEDLLFKLSCLHMTDDVIRFAKAYKRDAPRSKFAINTKQAQLFPVGTPQEVRSSCSSFDESLEKLPVEWRKIAAVKLQKEAAKYGIGTPLSIRVYTGNFPKLSYDQVALELSSRGRKTASELYEKVADVVRKDKPDGDTLLKLAHLVEQLDVELGNTRDTIKSIFSCIKKVAEVEIPIGNHAYTLSELQSVPPSIYRDTIGDDLAEDLLSTGDYEGILSLISDHEKALLDGRLAEELG